MLNLAGSAFDYASVLFAVLQECEHRRRSFSPATLEAQVTRVAREKLDSIHEAYAEAGGNESYWAELNREVLETALPQYVRAAARQNTLEENGFDLWRDGDLLARCVFALIGLTIGGLIVALPFIPIFEDAFAFFLALGAWFYPELKRTMLEYRHARQLNGLVSEAARYQGNARIHYVSNAQLDEAFRSVGRIEGKDSNQKP